MFQLLATDQSAQVLPLSAILNRKCMIATERMCRPQFCPQNERMCLTRVLPIAPSDAHSRQLHRSPALQARPDGCKVMNVKYRFIYGPCAPTTPGIKVDHMLHAGEVSDTQLAMADER
jgi:hypothetical protein